MALVTRVDVLRWVARPLLFFVWAFLGWGHLVVLVTLWNAATGGIGPALALFMPRRGDSLLWTSLNALSATLAVLLWLLAAGLTLWRRAQRESPTDD